MLSVILYGRNDNYGYNLHKRAALSLNCIAEILSDPADEILFVDYNTPDDYPTFPEAIQDTLTDRAREKLRILRVRSNVHSRYRNNTHLSALEPVSRNIAVRRSNPKNRWILSTNTDMIFVPKINASLSGIVGHLPLNGYYHLPRFELPETLWETFDRKDASRTIDSIRRWAPIAHLNEVVLLGHPSVKYDAPGDFQLILRDDLFKIFGFDEEMLLGWHVDSNIAKRLYLKYGKVGDLSDKIAGYHCDHTRQVTPMHRRNSTENDMNVFIENVTIPEKFMQSNSWGCPDEEIEEIRLTQSSNWRYLNILKTVIKEELREETVVSYSSETYDRVSYSAPHILPFLSDIFVNFPPKTCIGWIGLHKEMLDIFLQYWQEMNKQGSVIVLDEFKSAIFINKKVEAFTGDIHALNENANALVFDFYMENTKDAASLARSIDNQEVILKKFRYFVYYERLRLAKNLPPRRFVCVNVINNRFETEVNNFIDVSRTPFCSRIRQGYVFLPEFEIKDFTNRMCISKAGTYYNSRIMSLIFRRGNVMHTPLNWLEPGVYKVDLTFGTRIPWFLKSCIFIIPELILRGYSIVVVVMKGETILDYKEISGRELLLQIASLEFEVHADGWFEDVNQDYKIIIWTGGLYKFWINKVEFKNLSGSFDEIQ